MEDFMNIQMKEKDILLRFETKALMQTACKPFFGTCLFILALLCQVPFPASAMGATNEIVFYSSAAPGLRSQIYSIKPDGTGQINLSDDPHNWYLYPSWSADGTGIIYSADDRLWVMNSDGSNRVQLTFAGAGRLSGPVWSPDGKSIAFVHDGNGFQAAAIYLMNSDGSDVRWLTNIGPHDSSGWVWNYGLHWSPDGRKIVFTRVEQDGGRLNLYSINRDGSGEVALTEAMDLEFNINPAWSPDGSKIAFCAPTGSTNLGRIDIFVMNADGSNRQQITDLSAYAMDPSWSPDGRQLAFTANAGGDAPFDIHVMNADGTNIIRVTQNAFDSLAPRWRSVSEASISGRVVTENGLGLKGAVVKLTGPSDSRTATTGSLGYFHFENVVAGEIYTLDVKSKRFRFNKQTLEVNDSLTDLVLVGKQ